MAQQITKLDFSRLGGLKKIKNTTGDYIPYWFMLAVVSLLLISFRPLIGVICVAGGVAFVLALIKKDRQAKLHNTQLLYEFARDNAFEYLSEPLSVDAMPGTLFERGHDKVASQPIRGIIDGFNFTLFHYDYALSGRNRDYHYDAMVMEVALPRKLPHMVIDSLVEPGNEQGVSTLPIIFDRSQRLELEGDFYKYFALYSPDKYGITALTIIAPDAMEALMRHAALCDIEIIDNRLYFYWPEVRHIGQDYQNIFETTRAVLKEIGTKLSRGDIYGQASQAKIHAEGSNSRGVRLKRQGLSLAAFSTVAIFAAYFYLKDQAYGEELRFLSAIFIFAFAMIGYSIFQSQRQQRLRAKLLARYKEYDS